MDNARLMIYPPAEYWDRLQELQGQLKEKMEEDRSLRTKIQIGRDDFVLLTKTVGEKQWTMRKTEYYRPLPPSTIDKGEDKSMDYEAEEREKEEE